jgi:phosphoglycolate phosphatase-like HAD superfamily hydrolase
MKWKNIIFDFDGVIVNSNEIRIEGFAELFTDYPESEIKKLLKYARENGGISRYIKIRFFFEEIKKMPISEEDVNRLAHQYSILVTEKVERASSVPGAVEFIDKYSSFYRLAIVSGSDQLELRGICKERDIAKYFCTILGSPIGKSKNIRTLIDVQGWDHEECLYVGDSINDYDAAFLNNVSFLGVNSGAFDWATKPVPSINDLNELEVFLEDHNMGIPL